ncbi:multidrug effflux MFS transporter [Novosphingobium sp. CF614]|uniref:multidrug effflux MFS transporter n=1 Tax=Novosphingobium sp. CF614 TaxID=1884364 RepID=UPI000B85C4CC|nr:multidrug effflux MFS transporter [Novosphingobium sp. CF614]
MDSPQAKSVQFPLHQAEFVIMMAAFQALQALAIDVMLPALGIIARDLDVVDPNARQLIVGVFLISSGIGTLVPGALADRFGRRPVILIALCAYVLCSIACALAGSFTLLLVARALMGLSSSAMMVMPMTILRDRYEGDEMARTQSLVAMTFMVVPMVAPLLGQSVLLFAGWRWIFGIMATVSTLVFLWALVRLPETLRPEYRQPVRPGVVARNMVQALTVREAFGYFLGAAFVQGALFGYINSAQQLVGEHFGLGLLFPAVFGVMALIMASTNFVNSRIVERFGARRVSHTALLTYIGLAVIHFFLARNGEAFWVFFMLMTSSMCMMSFIGANFQAISLQPFARFAGAAASAMAFVRTVLGATLGAAIGQAYDGTARTILAAMVVCGVSALILVLYSERGRLFRRVNPLGFYKNTLPPAAP